MISSFCHLTQTGSPYLKAKERFHENFPEFWDTFVTERLNELKLYFERISEAASKAPIYFIRYEELVEEPYKVLVELFSFILGIQTY